jgi:hypothetical protein
MSTERCEQVTLADLADYAAGDLPEAEAAALEEHTFACADCARRATEYVAFAAGIRDAVRAAQVAGLITDAVLNRLAREGVRVRSYTLSPGDLVPCAVWQQDDVMVLRLRGDFREGDEITLVQRAAQGEEISRSSALEMGSSQHEILYAVPAAWVRMLPAGDIQVTLTHEGSDRRAIASYTLRHEGALTRH